MNLSLQILFVRQVGGEKTGSHGGRARIPRSRLFPFPGIRLCNTTHNAFMNKYICVRELMFRLFRDVSLGRLCSNSFIASARTPQHPGAVRLHINAFYFSVSARRVTSPTWGPPPPRKQALSFLEGFCVQIQIFE